MNAFHPLPTAGDDVIDFVIHVRTVVPDGELDEADLDDAGRCTTRGDYRIAVRPGPMGVLFARNQALEIFHAMEIITDPDDYRLIVSTYAAGIDTHLRANLGAWAQSPRPRRRPRMDLAEPASQRAQEVERSDRRLQA